MAYQRTIEGWHLRGDDTFIAPSAEQEAAWDALPMTEQDRIAALFDASLPEDDAVLDVLPGERAYERWKAA